MGRDDSSTAEPIIEGTFGAVLHRFMSAANPKWFGAYAKATRDAWGRELRLAARAASLGAVRLDAIRPALIQAFLDGLDGRPGKQANAIAALKAVEKWAIVRDILPREITTGVETNHPQGGHIPWTDEHVALAEKYARPELSRAVTLAANTGQRGSDLVRMRWTDIEAIDGRDGLNVTQQKTGRELWIPLTAPLSAAMETWERRPGFILLRPTGIGWTRQALSDAWGIERDNKPELAPLIAVGKTAKDDGLVMHGLRGTACVRLRRVGATIPQIADMVGMSVEMVARYCRFSAQRANAVAAVIHLENFRGTNRDMTKAGKGDK